MKRNYIVINDLHLGVQRQAGTTQESGAALRAYGHQGHRELLANALDVDADVIVNGDLTDAFDCPLSEALEIYAAADHFLQNSTGRLVWALGNHDLSKDSAKLGTVAFIGALLGARYPSKFQVVSEPTMLPGNVYVIPHLRNQDLFDLALDNVPDGTEYLLLHCNFDNKFAQAADNSLDITRAQVKGFVDRKIITVLGHEHQGRSAFAGRLLIVGNQIPSSVSDCLTHGDGQADGKKFFLHIRDTGHDLLKCWGVDDPCAGFTDLDWTRAAEVPDQGFVRISGKATAEQAADVVRAVAFARQKSKAFVVTNAVKVSATDSLDDLSESLEEVNSINVMEMLLNELTEDQQAVIRSLQAGVEA